jgi:hypothetical protein
MKRLTCRKHSLPLAALVLCTALTAMAHASDHLDSPATITNPQADIADIYAWTSPDGRQLNLIMTIQGHTFSDKVQYTLNVDSGKTFESTGASTSIVCRFAVANAADCKVGDADSAAGDPTNPKGLEGRNHRFRVYAVPMERPLICVNSFASAPPPRTACFSSEIRAHTFSCCKRTIELKRTYPPFDSTTISRPRA